MSAMIKPFGAALSWLLTVGNGSYTIEIPPEFGGPVTVNAYGFANSDPSFGSFGSISPSSWSGFTILSLYNSEGQTQFVVSGDAHLFSPVVKVNGANQNLGAGTFAGGKTNFTGTAANPFTGATQPVTIT